MKSTHDEFDICVAGGGPAGMIAAIAFAAAGFRTLCVDPASAGAETDRRSTAFMQPAQEFLDRIGLWEKFAPYASPLQVMRLVDAGASDTEPRRIRDFDAAELGPKPFGWNLPNQRIREILAATLAELPSAAHRAGTGLDAVTTRTSAAVLTLTDGSRVNARLVIGADGRNSRVRDCAGIGVRTVRFGQKALAFTVTHPEPHHDISTEVHRSGGPFTLVPLPDHEGVPCSAIVWMERSIEADRLAALPDREFEQAATERSCNLLGPLRLIGKRGLFPIISQIADRVTAERIALIAEAAHVVPPIGAQGLNMSLADISCLHDLAVANPAELGNAGMLGRYANARQAEMRLRVAGVGLLNRTSMVEAKPLRDLRMHALGLLHGMRPVRRALMRKGMGVTR
jgi:2-octaprenyl-6-methoxyphenol hydroxylase